jgi:hypothetical protein
VPICAVDGVASVVLCGEVGEVRPWLEHRPT